MDNVADLTLEILREIRDEISGVRQEVRLTNSTLGETNARLDKTNARLDETNARLDETNARLDAVREELRKDIREVGQAVHTLELALIRAWKELASDRDSLRNLTARVEALEARSSS